MADEKIKVTQQQIPGLKVDQSSVKEFTKGESLPTINIDIAMPAVKPAKPAQATAGTSPSTPSPSVTTGDAGGGQSGASGGSKTDGKGT